MRLPLRALAKVLTFMAVVTASTSTAWACTGSMTISAAPLSHTYSATGDRTIVTSGTVSKTGSFCGFAGIPAGTVQARLGGVTANIPYDKFSRKFSGNLVLPAGFTAGSYTLQMDFISANTSILNSRQTFSYTLKRARQTIDGLPFGTTTFTPGKTIALNVSASSGLPVTLSASPFNICALQAGKIVIYGAGNCSIVGTQSGNTNYLPGYGSSTIAVLRAQQTVSLPTVPTQTFVLDKIVPLTISTSSGTPIFLRNLTPNSCIAAGRDARLRRAGLCRFEVSAYGTVNYLPSAPVVLQFTIDPGPQKPLTLTSTRPNLVYGEQGALLAVGGSGSGAVTYKVTAGVGVCSINGGGLTATGVGTCTVTATKAADTDYLVATASATYTVTKATQTVYFTGPLDRLLVAGETIALKATVLSGQPITFSRDAASSSVCTVSGATLTVLSAGACTVTATQPGNANYVAAAQTASFKIITPVQTITFTAPGTQIFEPGRTINLFARSSAQLPVTIKTLTSPVCTISNSAAILHTGGICTLEAFNAGDATYGPTSTQLSFTVNKINLPPITLTGAPATIAFGDTATLSTTGGSGSGIPALSVTAGGSVCSLAGNTLTGSGVGTCTITASEAATPVYNAVSTTLDVTVAQADQFILFTPPAASPFVAGGSIALNARSNLGLPVTIATLSPRICGVSGSTAIIRSVGRCTLFAANPGNQNVIGTNTVVAFSIVSSDQAPLSVTAAPASIIAGSTTTLSTTGGSGTGAVSYALSAGAAFCTLSRGVVTGISVGACTVTATKAADANHTTAVIANIDIAVKRVAQAALNVTAAPAAILFNGSTTLSTSGGSGTGTVSFAVTAGASFCSLSGNALTGTGVGTCTVSATKAADANFATATANIDITVGQTAQTALTLRATPATITALTGPATLQMSGGSGTGAISYSVSSGKANCSIKGNQLNCAGVGTATVTSTKAADANFNAASASITVQYDTIDVAAAIAIKSGTSQSAVINAAFAKPLIVKVTDALGRPISGATVTFTMPLSGPGAALSVTTMSSDQSGLVSISARANNFPGKYAITATLAGGLSAAFSLTNNRDRVADIRETQSRLRSFISRRAKQILATSPTLTSRLSGFSQSAGGVIGLTGNGDEKNAQMAFSFSLRGALDAANRTENPAQLHPGQLHPGQPAMPGLAKLGFAKASGTRQARRDETGFDLWAEGKWVHANSGSTDATSSVIYGGVDYRFNPGLMMGVIVQLDWTAERDNTQSTSANGKGWLAGPYLVTRLHENLVFDGRIAWGKSANNIDALGLTKDKFGSTRWLAHGRLTGNFNNGAWGFNPNADLTYFEEKQHDYVDGLGNLIPGQTVALGRLTFGPAISYRSAWADGSAITPFLGVKGIWDFKTTDTASAPGVTSSATNGLRARLEGGLRAKTSLGLKFDASGFYDGIAAKDFQAYGGSLRLTVPIGLNGE